MSEADADKRPNSWLENILSSPFKFLVWSLSLLCASIAVVVYIWWNSTADIELALSEFENSGIELDVLNVLPPQSKHDRIQAYIKLVDLLEKDLTFSGTEGYDWDSEDHVGVISGVGKNYFPGRYTLTPKLVEHYQKDETQQYLNELISQINKIGFDPICFGGRDSKAGGDLTTITDLNDLTILLCEYAQVLPAKEFNEILTLLLKYLQIHTEGESIDALVCVAIVGLIDVVAASRVDEVSNELIEELDEMVVHIEKLLLKSVHYDSITLCNDWEDYLKEMEKYRNSRGPMENFSRRVRIRMNRDEVFYNQLKLLKASFTDLDTFEKVNHALHSAHDSGTLKLRKSDWSYHHFHTYSSVIRTLQMSKQMHLLIKSWKLEKTLPVDLLDPSGAKLRPIMDKGELVGAYSVGENGVDDGWEDEDTGYVYWLYDDLMRNY